MHLMLKFVAICMLTILPVAATADLAGPVRVIDADTWDVGDQRVRLHGIDAPEHNQTCRDADEREWRCGAWATAQTRALFEGVRASCKVLDRDRYDRLVARCFVGDLDAAHHIVAEGWAMAYLRYADDYLEVERAAASRALGLHRTRVAAPDAYRRGQSTGQDPSGSGCAIKGNINAKGDRIYHRPEQAFYGRTQINPQRGERWFCDPEEARAAGWRPAKR
ncbi:thermonuclease family protein [Aestuariivita sp.]|uniref:thermonuclease family protein n=1 Tax=Aestuariivita sp. TaxID=1872407 RepID=UPI0025BCA3F1|nr:thermonuclease family protein [Aestuariivita sp.]